MFRLDTMEFLEEAEKHERAMEIAYQYVMKQIDIEDLINFEDYLNTDLCYYLPFDPEEEDGRDYGTLDLLREYYENLEEYERCATLRDLISKISRIPKG